jgi:predicted DNA-binding transcriptional regulator YafY
MNVALTPELERRLMGYDQDFRVLEPASLAEAIDRKVQAMYSIRNLHPAVPGVEAAVPQGCRL